MALLLGGAGLVWAMAARASAPEAALGGRGLLALAEKYERLFWLGLGLQVMTGIGNLGALGAALPAPASAWGGRLALKLAAVLALSAFSLVRTLVVARLGSAGDGVNARAARVLPALYAVTTAALAAILVLAVALAHA
jgi:hypothetical protein